MLKKIIQNIQIFQVSKDPQLLQQILKEDIRTANQEYLNKSYNLKLFNNYQQILSTFYITNFKNLSSSEQNQFINVQEEIYYYSQVDQKLALTHQVLNYLQQQHQFETNIYETLKDAELNIYTIQNYIFYLSQSQLYGNIMLFIQNIDNMLDNLEKNIDILSLQKYLDILLSLSKLGVYSQEIKNFIIKKSLKANTTKKGLYYIIALTSLFHDDKSLIQTFIKENITNDIIQLYEKEHLYSIYKILLKLQVFNHPFWNKFNDIVDVNNQKCIYILKHMNIFKDRFAQSIVQSAPKQFGEMQFKDVQESHQKFELRIQDYLRAKNVAFLENHKIYDQLIDIYIPDKNLCIDVLGIQHFNLCRSKEGEKFISDEKEYIYKQILNLNTTFQSKMRIMFQYLYLI
ncbi:hypothetical protein pb186bvf_006141 [Paramecium bursaria]